MTKIFEPTPCVVTPTYSPVDLMLFKSFLRERDLYNTLIENGDDVSFIKSLIEDEIAHYIKLYPDLEEFIDG